MITFRFTRWWKRLKKDAVSLLVQELTAPDMMFFKCSKIDTSFNGNLALNVIEKKNEDDCPRYADRQEFSHYELYHLSKIELNN